MKDLIFYIPLGIHDIPPGRKILMENVKDKRFISKVGNKEFLIEAYEFGTKDNEMNEINRRLHKIIEIPTLKVSTADYDINIPFKSVELHPILQDIIEALNYFLLSLRRYKLYQRIDGDPILPITELFYEKNISKFFFFEIMTPIHHGPECISDLGLWKRFTYDDDDILEVQKILDNNTNLSIKMLLQAMEYLSKSDYRMSILHSVMALEISVKQYWTEILRNVGWSHNRIRKHFKKKSISNEKLLRNILFIYKKDKKVGKRLFEIRNDITHNLKKYGPFKDYQASEIIENVRVILCQLWGMENIWLSNSV